MTAKLVPTGELRRWRVAQLSFSHTRQLLKLKGTQDCSFRAPSRGKMYDFSKQQHHLLCNAAFLGFVSPDVTVSKLCAEPPGTATLCSFGWLGTQPDVLTHSALIAKHKYC